MKNNPVLNKITDNTKFIKELDALLKDSAKVYKIPKRNVFSEKSFTEILIDSIYSKLDDHPFFKNFRFSESEEFELYGHLEITSTLTSKIYQDNFESITIKFVENIDSIINNNYLISAIAIKRYLNNSISEYITYSIHEPDITSLNWISLNTCNGNFSMYLASDNNSYGFSSETISDYNAREELSDFVDFIEKTQYDSKREITEILNRAFFEEEILSEEKIEYYSLTQDIDLSVINKMSHLFINLDSFKLDNVYHNANQNKKIIKHSK